MTFLGWGVMVLPVSALVSGTKTGQRDKHTKVVNPANNLLKLVFLWNGHALRKEKHILKKPGVAR